MIVKELKKLLEQYPEDLEVLFCRYSDYDFLEAKDIEVVKAVPYDNDWAMRSHPTMSEENKVKEKEYLLFPGN